MLNGSSVCLSLAVSPRRRVAASLFAASFPLAVSARRLAPELRVIRKAAVYAVTKIMLNVCDDVVAHGRAVGLLLVERTARDRERLAAKRVGVNDQAGLVQRLNVRRVFQHRLARPCDLRVAGHLLRECGGDL